MDRKRNGVYVLRPSLILIVVSVTVGATTQAHAFGLGADFGYNRLILPQDPDLGGFGGDLYVRPLSLSLIEPEFLFGAHDFPTKIIGTVGYSYALYPLMVGARVHLPVVPIFLGAHLGAVCTHAHFGGGAALVGTAASPDSSTMWNFGFNVGGGYTFLDVAPLSLGISAWYHVVTASSSSPAKSNMLTVNLDVSFRT